MGVFTEIKKKVYVHLQIYKTHKITIMKKKLFSLSFCFLALGLFAQDKSETEKNKKVKPGRNILKVNLTSLALKNYSFQYERAVTKNISLVFGYRTMPTTNLPFQSKLIDLVGDGDVEVENQLKKVMLGNTAITPEIRFYTGRKGYGRGFYIAPFYRNASFDIKNLGFDYEVSPGVNNTIDLNGNVKANTFGLLFGTQLNLGKHVCLDLSLLGPHYGKSKGTLAGTSAQPISAADQQEIRDEIETFDIPLTKKTYTVNANGATVNLDGPWGGIRASISLGIRF